MSFKLRTYQQEAVDATIKHFRKTDESAVIVLPTGAGKSLVIAELARLAKRKILVLAHVKELVEQNHAKYEAYGLKAGIYSAGLKQKNNQYQVTFASIQSVARNLNDFTESYSLVVIDECHRVSGIIDKTDVKDGKSSPNKAKQSEPSSQYLELIKELKTHNKHLKVLGLTATPYRMGIGWIYQRHYNGFVRSEDPRPFLHCIYELPLIYMINRGYLTPPNVVDATVEHYDFSLLNSESNGSYNYREVNDLLERYPRVTQGICEQIIEITESSSRKGVMVFAATVKHAEEVMSYLPEEKTALVTGETPGIERDTLIDLFKQQKIRYLVNVSVLTTGFDAPHVDFIAILRPTESVSLYQQIVGRGLRLSDDKKDCLVIDYAGNSHNLFYPEVGEAKPSSDSKPVMVPCPMCEFVNTFWGKLDGEGNLIEHYGRRCQGLVLNDAGKQEQCSYRFRFKECGACGAENDIAARVCLSCHQTIVDPDDQLKSALKLKDAMVIRCAGVSFELLDQRLKVIYHEEQGQELSELFDFTKVASKRVFNSLFGKRFKQGREPKHFNHASEVIQNERLFTSPDFVIARKKGRFWNVQHRIFDYQGKFRKANEQS